MRKMSSHKFASAALILGCLTGGAGAQLLSNLEAFGSSVSLMDPSADPWSRSEDGPKEIAMADFDGDGLPDLAASKVMGRVAVVFGEGGKAFTQPLFLDPPGVDGRTARDCHGGLQWRRPARHCRCSAVFESRRAVLLDGRADVFAAGHGFGMARGARFAPLGFRW